VLVACGFCRFEFAMGAFTFALGTYNGGITGIHEAQDGWHCDINEGALKPAVLMRILRHIR
jgi:hypothetical protein